MVGTNSFFLPQPPPLANHNIHQYAEQGSRGEREQGSLGAEVQGRGDSMQSRQNGISASLRLAVSSPVQTGSSRSLPRFSGLR